MMMNKKRILGLLIVVFGLAMTFSDFKLTGAVVGLPAEPIIKVSGILIILAGIAIIVAAVKITSRIHDNKGLERLAEAATNDESVQRDIDHLTKELSKGNTTAGLIPKNLFGNISYLRGRNGGRVFYRKSEYGNGYEILAKCSKGNESQTIDKLTEIYHVKYNKKAS